MTNGYVSIRDGKPYAGTLPSRVELPVHKNEPVPHSRILAVNAGDPEWPEALQRWMFLQGYALASDFGRVPAED